MRILEHEIIHLIEFMVFNKSSCAKPQFKLICSNIFGHKAVKHQLITRAEIAQVEHNLKIGDRVEFEFEGKIQRGFVNRITKRATVMVPDRAGNFIDSKGKRYLKFYIPVELLRAV